MEQNNSSHDRAILEDSSALCRHSHDPILAQSQSFY